MAAVRRPVRPQLYLFVYIAIAFLLVIAHSPILDLPYYWDEIGQFIPASLDLFQKGLWIPHSTLPNVHPPGLMAWLASFWHIFGYSIVGTRVAMLLVAGFGATYTFLLAIELGRGTPGAPAFTALGMLFVCPLFFAQAMLAQLDMPAMGFTAMALLLFLQNRFRAAALACVALVLVKETGIVAPLVFGCWLIYERRPRDAAWFGLPAIVLALWLIVLRQSTGHWFGNPEFTRYNVFYPLNPVRLAFALFRRAYYLFVGSGHFIGTAALIWAWRRMPLLHARAWRVSGAFVALHCVAVSMLGGAVLERYLLPTLPVLYSVFAVALWSLLPRWRTWTLAALLVCLLCANFVNPVYPFPFENNLAFVSFVSLERRAAVGVEDRPGNLATTFPMANAFRRTEFGYVRTPRKIREVADFRRESIVPLHADPPEMMLVYDTTWDPLHILSAGPGAWLMKHFYDYQAPMTPDEIAEELSMSVSRRWDRGGLAISLLVRNQGGGLQTKAIANGRHR